jgi:hypothetical protein
MPSQRRISLEIQSLSRMPAAHQAKQSRAAQGSQTDGLATENAAIAGWILVPISVLASPKTSLIDPRSWFSKAHSC